MVDGPIRRPALDELETFLLAARHGSLTRAAQELRLSKTAVAKRLGSLEALVGHRLLDRGPRGAALTDEGRRLLPHVEGLLAESDRLFGRLADARGGVDSSRISGLRSLSGSSRVSTEQVLHETEKVFAEIFHATRDAIVVLRPEDGVILEVNDWGARLVGYPREDILGRTPVEIGLVPAAVLEEQLVAAGAPGGVTDSVVELRAADGAIHPVEFSLQLIVLAGEQRILCVARDISERVERERAIVKRAAQQEAVAALGLAALGGEATGDILARSAELCASHLDAALAAVWELAGEQLELRSAYGVPFETLAEVARTPEARERFFAIFDDRQEVAVGDITRDRRFPSDGIRGLGMRSVVSIPIGARPDGPYGALAVAWPDVDAFEPADVDFVRAVANILGLLVRDDRRAEADARRRVQLENFATLVDESPDPTVLLALDGHYVYMNASARRFRSVPPEVDPATVSIFATLDARTARRLREQVFPETQRAGRWQGSFTVTRAGARRGTPGRLTTVLVRDPVDGAARWIAAIFRPQP